MKKAPISSTETPPTRMTAAMFQVVPDLVKSIVVVGEKYCTPS
jgi:hypothetical protein